MIKNREEPAPGAGHKRQPELTSVRQFRMEMAIVPSTFWRWRKRGWIGQPLNIGGRLYLAAEQIAEFERRAALGEFSSPVHGLGNGKKERNPS